MMMGHTRRTYTPTHTTSKRKSTEPHTHTDLTRHTHTVLVGDRSHIFREMEVKDTRKRLLNVSKTIENTSYIDSICDEMERSYTNAARLLAGWKEADQVMSDALYVYSAVRRFRFISLYRSSLYNVSHMTCNAQMIEINSLSLFLSISLSLSLNSLCRSTHVT